MSSKTGVHGVLKSLGQSGPKATTKTGKLVMRIFLDQKENSFSAGTANINLQKGTRIGVYKATNKKKPPTRPLRAANEAFRGVLFSHQGCERGPPAIMSDGLPWW